MSEGIRQGRTLFANQTVISVIGVVGVASHGASSVADYSEVELWFAR